LVIGDQQERCMTEIFVLGQRYEVPEELTILKALEWAGFRLKRGVGCRAGFCGACGTVYRKVGDYRLYYALACQTVIEPGMVLGQIPFFPAQRATYALESLQPAGETLLELYPEILRCFGCNTCTKACPQEIDVLAYMAAALRGPLPGRARPTECGPRRQTPLRQVSRPDSRPPAPTGAGDRGRGVPGGCRGAQGVARGRTQGAVCGAGDRGIG
jgi:ferredoxin